MYTTIASCRMHYEVQGSGKPIVLLHGWGGSMTLMQFVQDHFAKQYCVINIDLPGFGKSEEPPEVWGVFEYAQGIHELLKQLQMYQPMFIAHSFGARIALRYASLFPVSKMVLTGAAGIKPKRSMSYYLKVYAYKIWKHIYPSTSMGSKDFQEASLIMRGVLVKSVEEDLRPFLSSIDCETLLVWGETDEDTPLWMGQIMEKEMKHATLVILENDDHFAYYHQAQRFVSILEYFL